jgi:hypothetical protein
MFFWVLLSNLLAKKTNNTTFHQYWYSKNSLTKKLKILKYYLFLYFVVKYIEDYDIKKLMSRNYCRYANPFLILKIVRRIAANFFMRGIMM